MVNVTEVRGELDSIGLGFLGLPDEYLVLLKILIFTLIVVFYSIFVWKFYRFISRKDILRLNLNKYNTSDHPILYKLIAVGFYIIEYIIILPFLIFFWFTVFVIFILILSDIPLQTILLVSGVIIAAIRMTSYYEEELSKDLAKALPFTLLVVFLTSSGFFSIEKIFTQIKEIPNLIGHIYSYLIFIIGLEIILRVLDLFFALVGLNPDQFDEEEKQLQKH